MLGAGPQDVALVDNRDSCRESNIVIAPANPMIRCANEGGEPPLSPQRGVPLGS
jgi:hypothetical protein